LLILLSLLTDHSLFFLHYPPHLLTLHSFPTRRSSDLNPSSILTIRPISLSSCQYGNMRESPPAFSTAFTLSIAVISYVSSTSVDEVIPITGFMNDTSFFIFLPTYSFCYFKT